MDLIELIRQLREEKKRLDQSILALEAIWREERAGAPPVQRKGRKSMPEQERLAVSQRMKVYWEEWRKRRVTVDHKSKKSLKNPDAPTTF